MTYAERITSALSGKAVDELPICPRLDLWYNANKRAGTLPPKYKSASLWAIVEDLDVGYNTTIPDFQSLEFAEQQAYRAIGQFQCLDIFFDLTFNLDVEIRLSGDECVTEFKTPYGIIRTRSIYNEKMREDGVTISHVAEKAFKSKADYAALRHVFESAEVVPRFDRVAGARARASNRGEPIVWVSSSASPMHYVQKHLMTFEQFVYEHHDNPLELAGLCESIGLLEDRIFAALVDCPLKVYRIGGNYDSMIQNPPFFRRYIAPFLKQRSDSLHAQEKILLSHTDGENDGLMQLYLESGIDVAESFCPAPMTRISVEDARRIFGDRVCIWGGIPSLMVLPSAYNDVEFQRHLDRFFEAVADGRRFIVSIADTVPPEADFERIKALIRRCKQFGNIPASFAT